MTFKTFTAIAALAATLPLTATAQSAGATQLARSLGVDPGVYSVADLGKAHGYTSEESSQARQQIAFILGDSGNSATTFGTRSAASVDQGVFPQDFGTENPNRLND